MKRRILGAIAGATLLSACYPVPTVVTPGLPRSQSPGTLFWYGWQTEVLTSDLYCRQGAEARHYRYKWRKRYSRCVR